MSEPREFWIFKQQVNGQWIVLLTPPDSNSDAFHHVIEYSSYRETEMSKLAYNLKKDNERLQEIANTLGVAIEDCARLTTENNRLRTALNKIKLQANGGMDHMRLDDIYRIADQALEI